MVHIVEINVFVPLLCLDNSIEKEIKEMIRIEKVIFPSFVALSWMLETIHLRAGQGTTHLAPA